MSRCKSIRNLAPRCSIFIYHLKFAFVFLLLVLYRSMACAVEDYAAHGRERLCLEKLLGHAIAKAIADALARVLEVFDVARVAINRGPALKRGIVRVEFAGLLHIVCIGLLGFAVVGKVLHREAAGE